MPHTEETDAVFPHSYAFKDGMMYPGDAPGSASIWTRSLRRSIQYQRAYLPVNRKLDGTLTDW